MSYCQPVFGMSMADMKPWPQELQRVLDPRGLAQYSWVFYGSSMEVNVYMVMVKTNFQNSENSNPKVKTMTTLKTKL
jgi:hypothetical protein